MHTVELSTGAQAPRFADAAFQTRVKPSSSLPSGGVYRGLVIGIVLSAGLWIAGAALVMAIMGKL